jgi:D-glycero-D-manno-heptose 1,7-bisphosphate phosphatase
MGIGGVKQPRGIFLDRDGVINRNVFNPEADAFESPHRLEDFELLPGVIEVLKRLQQAGYSLFLVSNQPSYAKGKTSLEMLRKIHERFVQYLDSANIKFSEHYYCFHHPEGIVPGFSGPCICRKPSPHFLLQAQAGFGLDLKQSWMIGDRETDIECGHAAGTRTIRIGGGRLPEVNETTADFRVRDLPEAADLILATNSR